MASQLEKQSVSVVLRGNFNPAIFQPSWFALQNLIRLSEAEAARVEIIHPDATVFTAEWLVVNVTGDRFHASTTQEAYYETLRDLVMGVFDLLRHTPLRVMGLNRDFHYRTSSKEAWHSLGHRLAPIGDWESVLRKLGMLNVTMQGERPDNLDGYIQVKVEPSKLVEHGVYVAVNDHYNLRAGDPATDGTPKLLRILGDGEHWKASMDQSLGIAQTIAGLGEVG